MYSLPTYLVVKKNRSCWSNNNKRTACKQRKHNSRQAGHDQGLRDRNIVVRLGSHQTSESDGSGECSEVDEDNGGQTLGTETILEHNWIHGNVIFVRMSNFQIPFYLSIADYLGLQLYCKLYLSKTCLFRTVLIFLKC